jgi:hypothetical protein
MKKEWKMCVKGRMDYKQKKMYNVINLLVQTKCFAVLRSKLRHETALFLGYVDIICHFISDLVLKIEYMTCQVPNYHVKLANSNQMIVRPLPLS